MRDLEIKRILVPTDLSEQHNTGVVPSTESSNRTTN